MALQTYTYDGPERFHSLVGQVMASLGYVGGREVRDVGAAVTVREEGADLHVTRASQPTRPKRPCRRRIAWRRPSPGTWWPWPGSNGLTSPTGAGKWPST